MNLQDVGLVAAGAAGGAAAMYLIDWLNRDRSGDDQPIILSGGSPLHIEPRNRKFGQLDPEKPDLVHHLVAPKQPTKSRKVAGVVVVVCPTVDVLAVSGGTLNVKITSNFPDITLKWDRAAGDFVINGHQIADYVVQDGSANDGSIDIPNFTVKDITVGSSGPYRPQNQKWQLIIHFRGKVGS